MSGNSFGTLFRLTTFGESHGAALGVVLDGVPAGIELETACIQKELDRRKPGQSAVATARQEADQVEILSGVFEGRTTGTALAMLIRNKDQHSKDYSDIARTFRPGHADFGYTAKYGFRDPRGGGRSSGRETAARVAAGAVAKKFLEKFSIRARACAVEIAGIPAPVTDWDEVENNIVRAADPEAAKKMEEAILAIRLKNDSCGGKVYCEITGVPAGLGEPVFDKLDALLAHAMLSLGAVKAISFGDGFEAARQKASEHNDAYLGGGKWSSNHSGGILGGISNGNVITFELAVKPTPSISQIQKTVDTEGNAIDLEIKGRHDPCIVPRIVPVVEAMAHLVIADCLLMQKQNPFR
ncbi:MAG: chorismate synthase [Lentisphaeria bacterium]|nr:chorismate synthase [Lentisphaeria bacterium]